MKLSIYLIKSAIRSLEHIFNNYDPTMKIDINITGAAQAHFYYKPTRTGRPKWIDLFEEYQEIHGLNLQSSSTSGVLVVSASNRLFALTFGYGRTLLNPSCFDERFGLLTTINSINHDSIRSIDMTRLDELTLQTREQSSKEGERYMFGIDVEKDVVRAITGTARNPEYGKRMSGTDNLNVTVSGNLSALPGLLTRYLERYNDNVPSHFQWINHIAQVRDVQEIERLNALLIEKINSDDYENLWLAPPEVVDWDNIDGFKYNQAVQSEKVDDLNIGTYRQTFDGVIDLATLKHKKIYAINSETERASVGWSAYKCIYCEIEQNGSTYILSSGVWYRIANDFVTDINERIARIPTSGFSLPDYNHANEGEYNAHVYQSDTARFAFMDSDPILFGGGHSSIEFCDLYDISDTRNKLIHVKRYGASSTFSHLFNQGVNSAIYMASEGRFRTLVNEKLPRGFHLPGETDSFTPSDYEVVFAVISKSAEERVNYPFFSKVSLANANRELTSRGFSVSLLKIKNIR